MKLDVVMCTWNSNKPYFVRCLNSIKKEIPVHHFILVDRFSEDGTVETVRKVFPNAKVIESNSSLGTARKLGIKLVDTEFFVLVDSDIELCDEWFKLMANLVDSKTGAVQGRMTYALNYLQKWIKVSQNIQAKFNKKFRSEVVVANTENPDIFRGSTHNTLVRTRLAKDWNPPVIVSAYEDHLLLRHIVRKGYEWKTLSNVHVKDHGVSCLADYLKKGRWNMAGARLVRYNNISIWSLVRVLLLQSINALFASLQTKEPMVLLYVTLFQFSRIQGWVNWITYLEMKR